MLTTLTVAAFMSVSTFVAVALFGAAQAEVRSWTVVKGEGSTIR